MSHMIDMSLGRPAIAYVGATPWHGLGKQLTPGKSIAEWTREAGLEYEVLAAPVEFTHRPKNGGPVEPLDYLSRRVLYRSDTLRPLSVVSDRYNPVQPAQVMEFFAELADIGGFELETAGAIADGARVWALARIGDGAPVLQGDEVRPYVLLATSYDGTLATTGKTTTIRVVCWNTLSASAGAYDGQSFKKEEMDTINTLIRVPHRQKFESKVVRQQLGIYRTEWEKFLIQAQRLARQEIDLEQAAALTVKVLKPSMPKGTDVRASKQFARIIDLFDGQAKGSELAGPTLWGLTNAFTQYVDFERGRDKSRLNSAWFGAGNTLKDRAFAVASAAAAA